MSTPRETARAVTELAGIPDTAAEEALTRLIANGRHGGWNSLTQGDFDTLQDAFDDATGRPRRKHSHPLVWKARFWWHWHVTDPIVYPVTMPVGDFLAAASWCAVRRFLPRAHRVAIEVDGADWGADDTGLRGRRQREAWVREHAPGATVFDAIRGLLVLRLPDTDTAYRYRDEFGITAPIQAPLLTGHGWVCPPCRIRAGVPGDAFDSEAQAAAAFSGHVHDSHGGRVPDGAQVDEIEWLDVPPHPDEADD